MAGYTSQAHLLLGCGLDGLLATGAADEVAHLKRASEAKTLILPGEMGERFQAIALTRGIDRPLRGFASHDLRMRL